MMKLGAEWMRRTIGLVGIALAVGGCAGMGSPQALQDRSTCIVVAGAVGALAGGIVAHNTSEGETDERLVGAGLGAAAGAALGSLICAEGRRPQAPEVSIDAQPLSGSAPLEVAFAVAGSDPDGRIVSHDWEFGDGESAQGARVGHTYTDPGSYDVTLTVTDDDGLEATATTRIDVDAMSMEPEPEPEPEQATSRRIVLRGINFGFDSAEIGEADQLILDVAVEQLRTSPDVQVRVVGHTDSVGAENYNQALSERRARAVVDYLVDQGISRDRLSAEGEGESEPVASNETPDGRAQNRRVELDILE